MEIEVYIVALPMFLCATVCAVYLLNRRWRRGLLWLGVTVLVSSAWYYISSDPLLRSIIIYHGENDTRYSAGFNEKEFDRATAGQSMDEIRRRLGPPLEVAMEHNVIYWTYATYPNRARRSRNYWLKGFVCDPKTRRVIDKFNVFNTP